MAFLSPPHTQTHWDRKVIEGLPGKGRVGEARGRLGGEGGYTETRSTLSKDGSIGYRLLQRAARGTWGLGQLT